MTNTTYLSLREQFVLRHGGEDKCINVGGILVFPDGATLDHHPHGLMSEPSDDPYELAKVQLAFHEELLKRASRQFAELKTNLLSMSISNRRMQMGVADASGLEQLKELQKVVRGHQKKVAELRERSVKAKPQEVRQREVYEAIDRQNLDLFEQTVRDLKI